MTFMWVFKPEWHLVSPREVSNSQVPVKRSPTTHVVSGSSGERQTTPSLGSSVAMSLSNGFAVNLHCEPER